MHFRTDRTRYPGIARQESSSCTSRPRTGPPKLRFKTAVFKVHFIRLFSITCIWINSCTDVITRVSVNWPARVRLTPPASRKLNNGQNLLCNLAKMTISEYLQIHDAALLDAAAIIDLRGGGGSVTREPFCCTEREHGS